MAYFSKIELKLYEVRNEMFGRRTLRTEKWHMRWSEREVLKEAEKILRKVEAVRPGSEWRLVQTGKNKFNIMWFDYKNPAEKILDRAERKTA